MFDNLTDTQTPMYFIARLMNTIIKKVLFVYYPCMYLRQDIGKLFSISFFSFNPPPPSEKNIRKEQINNNVDRMNIFLFRKSVKTY